MTEVKVRKAFPVQINNLKLYCESMKLSAETAVFESSTVTGYPLMTNKDRKMLRLSFTGRVYNENTPMRLAGFAANYNNYEGIDIIYRDLRFPRCIITGFSAEDSGEDYITLTVNAATNSSVGILSGVSE